MPARADEIILSYLRKHPGVPSSKIVKLLGISRQKVAARLSRLVATGKITRTGSTRNAKYFPSGQIEVPERLRLVKSLAGLEEDRVFDEIDLRLGLRRKLAQNVFRIIYYAFTEMLNNAIDHSGSQKAEIEFNLSSRQILFTIRDRGVGVFANVQTKFRLASEFEALEHLIKGKQTTLPERHTGQGIFFTSRIADRFTLRSHKLEYTVDNRRDDLFVAKKARMQGTLVTFEILRRSRKQLQSIFDAYSNDDFEFDRTNFRVRLTAARELLSRSQAKRILTGLEAYRKIILDFQAVREIGQGFADEIFRVFRRRHPEIEVTFENANEAVSSMILRVLRSPEISARRPDAQ